MPLVPPEFRDEHAIIRERVHRGERIEQLETIRLTRGGERIRLALSSGPVRDEAGVIVGTVNIIRDIRGADLTPASAALNQRIIERQLAELEQLYLGAPAGIGFTDLEHRFISLNARLAALNGISVSEHLGKRLEEVLPELSAVLEPLVTQVIRSGEPVVGQEIRGTTRAAPGVPRYWLAGYYPVKSPRGEVLGVSTVVQDITAARAVENELVSVTRQLEIILAEVADPILIADNDWRLTYVNEPAAKMLGSNAGIMGQSLLDLMPNVLSDRGEEFIPWLRLARDTSRVTRFENRDSSGSWYENTVHPSVDRLVLLRRDITAIKTAERNTRESESIYRAIGDSMDYGVWICDAEGRNLYTSESFRTLVGLTQAECAGFGWTQALRPEHAPKAISDWLNCVRDQKPSDAEYWFRGVDGEWHPILSRGVPVFDEAGQLVFWTGIFLDIRAFKTVQQQLEDANESLSRTNEELEQFAYFASHDLQEPLRLIRFLTGLVSNQPGTALGPDSRKYLAAIEESAERMTNLVRDLLEYARMLHNAPAPNQISDLNEAIKIALENCQPAIDEANARVSSEDLPQVTADIEQIARVFQNLISNSIKYRRQARPEIEITVNRRGAEWRFCVADNGQGIAPEQEPLVFQPFKRLHGKGIPGSGLGLAICRRIVQRHGGRIWHESEPGVGSLFFFTLPAD